MLNALAIDHNHTKAKNNLIDTRKRLLKENEKEQSVSRRKEKAKNKGFATICSQIIHSYLTILIFQVFYPFFYRFWQRC